MTDTLTDAPAETPAPSPNQDERTAPVSLVVLHYTGMRTGEAALARMRDPQAKVSAHVMVGTDGRVFRMVPDDRRAWHAGVAEWRGQRDVNARSVGIEVVNPGHEWGYEDFPEAQVGAVCRLVRAALDRFGLGPEAVIGHADVAPHRKEDPGERFPWGTLAARGLALPPWDGTVRAGVPEGADALRLLEGIGYPVTAYGGAACCVAFQRRFVPAELGQGLSPATRAAIGWAAALL